MYLVNKTKLEYTSKLTLLYESLIVDEVCIYSLEDRREGI